MFKDKVLLITGGTGSFGNAVLKRFLNSDVKEIRVLSRDEKKQEDMRKIYNNDKLKFYIGDVRDYNSIEGAFIGVDYVFHAAALKQVPSCEFYPLEAQRYHWFDFISSQSTMHMLLKFKIDERCVPETDKRVFPILEELVNHQRQS
jgi:UDP-N-acetylglucosamine 4,6-dehydratase